MPRRAASHRESVRTARRWHRRCPTSRTHPAGHRPRGAPGHRRRRVVEHAGDILATATPTTPFHHDPPLRPTFADALDAARRRPLRGIRHHLSDCVVCSPSHAPTDSAWSPPRHCSAPTCSSHLCRRRPPSSRMGGAPEALWGALDCTSFPADLLPHAHTRSDGTAHRAHRARRLLRRSGSSSWADGPAEATARTARRRR